MVLIENTVEPWGLVVRSIKRKASLRFGGDVALPVSFGQVLQVHTALVAVAILVLDPDIGNDKTLVNLLATV